jgi:hypothetical protein
VVGDLLHQKTLCAVVGAEGEDFAFAVNVGVSNGKSMQVSTARFFAVARLKP